MSSGPGRPPAASAGFTKRRTDAPAQFFAWEAAGLGWLSEATTAGGAEVVKVRDVGPRQIVLDRIDAS